MKKIILVEISARHCHLSVEHLGILFGQNYELKVKKYLSQPGQFAAQEKISIKTNLGVIENITIVGPCRLQTQIEISATDARKLGINPPVRLSGDLKNSAGGCIIGPNGSIDIKEGIIIARRHIHCDLKIATEWGLKDNQTVSVEVLGARAVTFHNVIVRIRNDFKLAFHIDTDEGNTIFSDGNISEGCIL